MLSSRGRRIPVETYSPRCPAHLTPQPSPSHRSQALAQRLPSPPLTRSPLPSQRRSGRIAATMSNQDWDKVVMKPKAQKGKKAEAGAGGSSTEKKCTLRAARVVIEPGIRGAASALC